MTNVSLLLVPVAWVESRAAESHGQGEMKHHRRSILLIRYTVPLSIYVFRPTSEVGKDLMIAMRACETRIYLSVIPLCSSTPTRAEGNRTRRGNCFCRCRTVSAAATAQADELLKTLGGGEKIYYFAFLVVCLTQRA